MRCSASSPLARRSVFERIRVGIQNRRWKRIWNGARIWDSEKCIWHYSENSHQCDCSCLVKYVYSALRNIVAKDTNCCCEEVLHGRRTGTQPCEASWLPAFLCFILLIPKSYQLTCISRACQEEQVRWCCWVLGDGPGVWVLWGGAWSGGIQEIDI